jgi:nucleotide-binding universal stress UspA family protein
MFQRILISWDGSDTALRAFEAAIDLTRRYGAELVALSIAYSPAHAETDADREESAAAAYRYLEETFAEVRDRAIRVGIDVEHQIVAAEHPVPAILDYVHEHGFDLIVCGHHHSRRAGRLLLGGVAQDLVSAAATPVLVVGEDDR